MLSAFYRLPFFPLILFFAMCSLLAAGTEGVMEVLTSFIEISLLQAVSGEY